MSNGMQVTIYSAMADNPEWRINALYEERPAEPTWTGEVEARDLEDIFRIFNRVDDEDCERLDEIGYHLPSLSVGDVVSYDGTYKIVAFAGFKDIAEDEYRFIRQSRDPRRAGTLVLTAIHREEEALERASAHKLIRKGLARYGTHHYFVAQRLLGRDA